MDIKDERIDGGKAFDRGRTSGDYARFRDIYPTEFYEKIAARGIGISRQSVLDLGTGTGVLPRNSAHGCGLWIIIMSMQSSSVFGSVSSIGCAAES